MKKLAIMFITLVFSIFAFAKPAYAYFELDPSVESMIVVDYEIDSTYTIGSHTVYVVSVLFNDIENASANTVVYFNTTYQNAGTTYIKFSNNNGEYQLNEFTYFGSSQTNIDNYVWHVNTPNYYLYIHLIGLDWYPEAPPLYNAGVLLNVLSFYDGTMHTFFNNIQGYSDGYTDGYTDGYDAGSNVNYSLAYDAGYEDGQYDIFNDGSKAYGFNVVDSFDYFKGYQDGRANTLANANIGFMEDFGKWIVPTIIIVLLLGSFIYIRNRGGDV